jgi:hypothetical protein
MNKARILGVYAERIGWAKRPEVRRALSNMMHKQPNDND